MTNDEMSPRFRELITEAKKFSTDLEALLPELVSTRRNYMRTRSPADEAEMNRVQKRAQDLSERHSVLYKDMQEASGLPDDILNEIDRPHIVSDEEDHLLRDSLTEEHVEITGLVDDQLADTIDTISKLFSENWLKDQAQTSHQLDDLADGSEYLSIVKGLRPESEFHPLHRLRQMLRVSSDYLRGNPAYDHFAGATLVPQLAQLGRKLENLKGVAGADERLRRLSDGDGSSVDATIFELLVAARCAEVGRNVEFLEETGETSPDIRCHDPFPMLIECKRRRALSDYESAEEGIMRQIFLALQHEAQAKGLTGRFELRLTVEAQRAPTAEVVTRMISQRLAAHPERHTEYAWGSVAFTPLPRRFDVSPTKLYGPNMLRAAFDWNSDVPEWDGIICQVDGAGAFMTDEVRNPIGLVWNNSSRQAIVKRAWAPLDLFGDATNQITPGEFAVIYLAYTEGARSEIADERVQRFLKKMPEWDHPGSVRIPISFLVRLYPRALNEGQPDLIESTIRLYSGLYGDPRLFEDFPNSIFTNTPSNERE
jgi:hypothetical protein